MNRLDREGLQKDAMMGVSAEIMQCVKERKMHCPWSDMLIKFVDFDFECSIGFFSVYTSPRIDAITTSTITAINLQGVGVYENGNEFRSLMRVEYDEAGPSVIKYVAGNAGAIVNIATIAAEGEAALKKLRDVFDDVIKGECLADLVFSK